MDTSTHYVTGQEIHVGDQILLSGKPGEVAFVIGIDEYDEEFASQRDWYSQEYKRGFMIRGGGLGLVLQNDSDEDIVLISRKREDKDGCQQIAPCDS